MPYDNMNKYATRQYDFSQRILVAQLTQAQFGANLQTVQRGMCTSLVALWLKEKLTTSGGSSGTATRFVGPSSDAANLQIVQDAATHQLAYHHALADLDTLFTSMGLPRPRPATVPAMHGTVTVRDVVHVATEVADLLAYGEGALIEVTVHDATTDAYQGRHAVGLYLSRGGSLYFFEPNAGVFLVEKSTKRVFFEVWVACSLAERNWLYRMNTNPAPLTPADGVHLLAR